MCLLSRSSAYRLCVHIHLRSRHAYGHALGDARQFRLLLNVLQGPNRPQTRFQPTDPLLRRSHSYAHVAPLNGRLPQNTLSPTSVSSSLSFSLSPLASPSVLQPAINCPRQGTEEEKEAFVASPVADIAQSIMEENEVAGSASKRAGDNVTVGHSGGNNTSPTTSSELTNLSPSELIARIIHLEAQLKMTTKRLAALTNESEGATKSASVSDGVFTEDRAHTQDSNTIPISRPRRTRTPSPTPQKVPRPFDFTRYDTRLIALKFAYIGRRYNGFEHSNGTQQPLRPTIEEALWKALRKARLIPPNVPDGCDGSFSVIFDEKERRKLYWTDKVKLEIDWNGLQYSKCGRTDKGVSAFGQVIGIRVRSNRPRVREGTGSVESEGIPENQAIFDDVKDELPYLSILNSILPSDIKLLAWCPNPDPLFDARFSCEERRYKYFFTNPAFCPTPGYLGLNHASGAPAPVREGWLDIDAMRAAAKKLEGLHDFRNFCKIDASKQMSSCQRRVTFADVEEMTGQIDLGQFLTNDKLNRHGANAMIGKEDSMTGSDTCGPRVFTFTVHGTAFLWHQVRCMVAILFLVGQGLERPEIVDELLDIARNPSRPHYDMADDAPLVLWDCVFPHDEPGDGNAAQWIYSGDKAGFSALTKKGEGNFDGKFGSGGIINGLWSEWRKAKMQELLTAGLLTLALGQGDDTPLERAGLRPGANPRFRSQRIFDGSNTGKTVGDYVPVMQRRKMDTLEVQNAKYLATKQAKQNMINQ